MGNKFVTGIVLSCIVLFATPLAAQVRQPDPRKGEIASDPIKCWWKTDKSAVQIGEQFTLTLTCGVIETRDATVIAKMEQLDPGAVQLAPFELVGGTRHEDIQAPPWRYFQYDYTVRLIGEDFFGEDIDIPALTVTYSIKSNVAGASEGLDQMYVLPSLPIRIMSLVPKTTTDIRDTARESFAAANARLSRATTEFIAAGIFFGFSVLMLAFAAVHLVRRYRVRGPVKAPAVSQFTLMRACLAEIGRLQSEVTRAGWTPERAGSALTILRIGSAVAMGRPVAQTPTDTTVPAREGQLAVRKGILTMERIVASAPITSDAIERHKSSVMLADLGKSLAAFTAVRYGRNGNIDAAGLNRALENGRIALQRLRFAMLWPMRFRSAVWTR
jgi:hypothetical protein